MSVQHFTKDTFQASVLESTGVVLVDFWAQWCGPCQMFSPIVDQFAEENPDAVKVGKVNVDEQPELAGQYGVMSIPTAILFQNGEAVKTLVGLQPKEALEDLIK